MISWIQKNFQQHFKTLFLVLLGAMIISFIVTIGNTPGLGNATNKSSQRNFFGFNLASKDDQKLIFGDASLSVYLLTGNANAVTGDRLTNFALNRQAAIALANKLGIPGPDQEAAVAYIKTLGKFQNDKGEFDPKLYTEFQDSLKTNPGMNEEMVTRVISDDVRANEVRKLLSGPGYVLPGDIAEQLTNSETKWDISVAKLDYNSFKPGKIEPTEDALKSYFEQNSFKYEIPAQVKVDSIEFNASSYTDKVTLKDDEIRAYYDANPQRFPKPANPPAPAKPIGDTPDEIFAAVKPQVENALRMERAKRLAEEAAADFAYTVFDKKVTPDSVPEIAKQYNVALRSLPPFSQQSPDPSLRGSTNAVSTAFKLTADAPISDMISTPRGAVILVWRQSIEARTPSLDEVRPKVTQDYTESQKRSAFVAKGAEIKTAVEAAVKSGKTFEDAIKSATESAGITTTVTPFKDFTRMSPPKDMDRSVFNTLEDLKEGEISNMVITSDESGLIVQVAHKILPDVTEANPRYNEIKERLASYLSGSTANALLDELVEKELAPPKS